MSDTSMEAEKFSMLYINLFIFSITVPSTMAF
jgi:hypothetical protein